MLTDKDDENVLEKIWSLKIGSAVKFVKILGIKLAMPTNIGNDNKE